MPAGSPAIYVVNRNANIAGYPGYASGTNVVTPSLEISGSNTVMNQPFGLALDATGNIYVGSFLSHNVLVFAQTPGGNEAPYAELGGSMTGIGFPSGIAFDSLGRIYVAESDTGDVFVFPPIPAGGGMINEPPIADIGGSNTGLGVIIGVAVDSMGRVYVSNDLLATISVFPPVTGTGTLNEAPVATISGSNTGLSSPYGIALDTSGKVYVTDSTNNAILVYPANPVGALNEAPLATIAGSNTGLNSPESVAVDASGVIYAASLYYSQTYTGSITVYPANPTGTLNETPLATILSTNTDQPDGIGVSNVVQTNSPLRKRPRINRRP